MYIRLPLNLFIQLNDLISFQLFFFRVEETNPFVAAAIINCGVIWGLLYYKILASVAPDICLRDTADAYYSS
jgi:hypothetical protein